MALEPPNILDDLLCQLCRHVKHDGDTCGINGCLHTDYPYLDPET